MLSIHDMVRIHGLANALGFTVRGLLGHRLARSRETNPRPLVAT